MTIETVDKIDAARMYIRGQWVPAISGRVAPSVDPFSGKPWMHVADGCEDDADQAISAARHAFDQGGWGTSTARYRAQLLRRLGGLIARDADRLAEIESRDNGKLLKEMRGQWAYLPEWFYYYAGLADKVEGATLPSDRENFIAMTRKEPAGVVVGIAPWNSPALLLCWKVAPALAAGCTFVAKPSEHTPASAIELAKLFDEAGFPPGVFNVVTGGPELGKSLCDDPRVDRIAFTGSTEVGKAIAKAAADNLTGVLLELGGKSPNIVFEDCDPEAAANGIIAGIFAATGQTCMAGSRLLIQRSVMDEVLGRVIARAKTIRMGDPRDPDTDMGPVANAQQFAKVTGMIQEALAEGAVLACGGPEDAPDGLFVAPTILTNVTPDMTIVQEEVFGPVLTVLPFDTEEEAIQLANNTDFGLAAGIWTLNIHRAHRMANAVRAGTVWINAYRIVSYNAPFGGFGLSGQGRENGKEAIEEYLETKTIWIELTGATRDPFTIG
ncbi:aldehyde dehydrogenase [uncultured Sneathiella sp.]|uniref:aldehyde dehydrogenase n=1 Tax=uncultured Sneathiella sp. TaxID=879315 RepID=UPI0025949692|nr:aldehyde dehydrogenase [uncultured Sneathiella sp.]